MRRLMGTVLVAVFVLAGCGGSSLAQDDPNGYAACSALVKSRTTTDTATALGALMEAGSKAGEATTESIRNAAEEIGAGFAMPGGELVKACEDAGVKIPKSKPKS